MSSKIKISKSAANLLIFLFVALSVSCVEDSPAGQGTSNFKFLVDNKLSGEKESNKAADRSENKANNFKSAAKQNEELKKTLSWGFGKKNQIGWYLYVPLIQHTIESEENADSEKFAEAVAVWQKRNGLLANGIIDRKTLLTLVKFWQSRRLGKSENATEDMLLTAPSADFYDPSREAELTKVERETHAAYKRMVAAAAKDLNLKFQNGTLATDEKFLKIISAYRSREYQESLRRKSPNSGRAGLAVNSPHFTGRALDIYVGGEPVATKDENRAIQIETPAYKWLVKNAEKFGFRPYFYEPWHWEYVLNK